MRVTLDVPRHNRRNGGHDGDRRGPGTDTRTGRRGLRHRAADLERGHSAPASRHSPLYRLRRRAGRRALRSGAGSADRDSRRRSRRGWARNVRRRHGDRPVDRGRRAGRSTGGNGTGSRGLPMAPRRSRDPGLRSGGDRWHRHPYRDRRADTGRRDRPPHAPLRTHHRQPPVLRPDHRRWRLSRGEPGSAPRSVLGPSGWRWQLRRRHVLQVPAPPARPHRARRRAGVADGRGGCGVALFP